MIFTYRPLYASEFGALRLAAQKSNYPVKADPLVARYFGELLSRLEQTDQSVYWFSGDVGIHYPLLYHRPRKNLHLIASGLYENEFDNVVRVSVGPEGVDLEVIGLGKHAYGPIADYGPKWLAGHLDRPKTPRARLSKLANRFAEKLSAEHVKGMDPVEFELRVAAEKAPILYADNGRLHYLHRPEEKADDVDPAFRCDNKNGASFFLHVYPHKKWRLGPGQNFDNRDGSVKMKLHSADSCCYEAALPGYWIDYVDTGIYDERGRLWWVRIKASALTASD